MLMRIILFGSFLFSFQIVGQKWEYHILAYDTCYFELVGGDDEFNQQLLSGDSTSYNLDRRYPSWQMKSTVPDGKYFIYHARPYYSLGKAGDTISVEIGDYMNGKVEGKHIIIDHFDKSVLSEKYYRKGILLKSIEYNRQLSGTLGPYFYGFPVYPDHYHPYNQGEIMTTINEYDSIGTRIFTTVILTHDEVEQKVYENFATSNSIEFREYYYFLNEKHNVAQERIIHTDTLILKRWCENGELYFHLEEVIMPIEYGNWITLESKMLVNRFKVRSKPAYYYCAE